MRETTVTVVGHVATKPALRLTTSGVRVASFRLGTTERRWDKSLKGWRDGDTVFWTITCWRNVADNVLDSLAVGDPVVAHGRLRDGGYEKDGVRRTVFEVEAYSLGHDLSRGVSAFRKATVVPGHRDLLPEEEPEEGPPTELDGIDGIGAPGSERADLASGMPEREPSDPGMPERETVVGSVTSAA